MKRKVYLETSVISYLTARPSNDPIKSACQQITRSWWKSSMQTEDRYISPYVIEEISSGDATAAQERLEVVKDIPLLTPLDEIDDLAKYLLHGGGLPQNAYFDALHIACASFYKIDVLLTWNCTHIANPAQLPVIRGLCSAMGHRLPELVTPFDLMEIL